MLTPHRLPRQSWRARFNHKALKQHSKPPKDKGSVLLGDTASSPPPATKHLKTSAPKSTQVGWAGGIKHLLDNNGQCLAPTCYVEQGQCWGGGAIVGICMKALHTAGAMGQPSTCNTLQPPPPPGAPRYRSGAQLRPWH
jgi:hypothetical protein